MVGLANSNGEKVVAYTYDAWGNIRSTTGSLASTLGQHNPLRYRGYVYDTESGYYYLQSRYYDPEIGRFLNADAYASTGQGLLGNNMFAYCQNNPVNYQDPTGEIAFTTLAIIVIIVGSVVGGTMGAMSAATTGGNIAEAAIEGAITGAIASACGLLIPNPGLAIGAATLFGFLTDISVQHTSHMINTEDISTDWGRAIKVGIQTGLGTAIPQLGSPTTVAEEAFATALIWAEGSTLITVTDIVVTKFIEKYSEDTNESVAGVIRIWN